MAADPEPVCHPAGTAAGAPWVTGQALAGRRTGGPYAVPDKGSGTLYRTHAAGQPGRPVAAAGTAPAGRNRRATGLRSRPTAGRQRHPDHRADPEIPQPRPADGDRPVRDQLPLLLPPPLPLWLPRSEEHTSELQSRPHLVCRLLLEKKK